MARFIWKNLLEHDGDTLLKSLHDFEQEMLRAIRGIGVFLLKKVPELLRESLAWLQAKCVYACRVAIRLSRIVALGVAWLAIVFGPLALYVGIPTFIWVGVAIAGSAWGVRQKIKKQGVTWAFNKDNHHARA